MKMTPLSQIDADLFKYRAEYLHTNWSSMMLH